MAFVLNFPLFAIILSLFSGPLSTVLDKGKAKALNRFVILSVGAMMMCVLLYCLQSGECYVYKMGHFPAPWGNEIRIGVLEAFMSVFFCIIMFLAMLGGSKEFEEEIEESKKNLYYVMVNLLLCSLLALVYTNDIFTAYVFVEINTISACGLIMIRQSGRAMEAAMRYMIMSLLGSGMLLLGICYLYAITGELLMSSINEQVELLYVSGEYHIPLMLSIGLMCVGLAIKSALYPFHTWVPNAYGNATLSSQAILSSLVSKGYILLLIKILLRVIGMNTIWQSNILNVLFVFGILGMIMGSVHTMNAPEINSMISYSSVAQIGYIYMGIGLGSKYGFVAAVYHIICHGATKSLLFLSASGLSQASDTHKDFKALTGSGHRNLLAGAAFSVGALSMVGIPMFAGFISKYLFAEAAVYSTHKLLPTMIALALSTLLNTVYYLKTMIRIYTDREGIDTAQRIRIGDQKLKSIAIIALSALNIFLGLFSEPVIDLIEKGVSMFA
ncbi:MAG: sodium:proton antiporter [Eubacterium sp.]|nr:sodium:proton antiporter [Eubacterium sp.]